jgi:flagellar biosynthesis anti-sigma factor FlgM
MQETANLTTRIDENQGTTAPSQTDRHDAGRTSEQPENAAAPVVTADRVEAARDVDFVNSAVQAAQDAPAIRADKVAQAKKALADGTLGADAGTLADVLIDHMLDDTK